MKYSCEALKNTMEIQHNGDVVPCSFLSIPIGNVRKTTLSQIWISDKANELKEILKITKNAQSIVIVNFVMVVA